MAKTVCMQQPEVDALLEKQVAVPSSTAARILGISPRTLSNWRVQGRGPRYVKVGSNRSPVLYRISDIEEWLDSRVVERGGKKTSARARR
ncbi:MAG: helix-turn-helix domain-containing protein [Atopobiaceae bacterium]|nr:helix-turn-helix domain-containing protein [Atopobiaceae bacterium]